MLSPTKVTSPPILWGPENQPNSNKPTRKSPQTRPTDVTGGKRSGGAEGTRTPDPHNAIVVLYQLSYDPTRQRQI